MTPQNDAVLKQSDQAICVETKNRLGLITLKRTDALNALTGDMVQHMEPAFHEWVKNPHVYSVVIESSSPKAFCAGADIRALYHMIEKNPEDAIHFFRLEYQNNLTIGEFYKPIIPLINGVVMGGGVGISWHGTHCVMGENTRFAMPEVSIGLFPDVGTSYRLAHLPHQIGFYLALTGTSITAADCHFLEIASHTIKSDHFSNIRELLTEAEPVDELLEGLHEDFGKSEIRELAPVIEQLFQGDRVEDILENLKQEAESFNHPHSEWAKMVLADIRTKSPLSVKVTFELLKRARQIDNLKDALEMDFRIASRFMLKSDFREGVRALLIDKDKKPKWQHANIEAVPDDLVQSYFENLGNKELILRRYDLDVPV